MRMLPRIYEIYRQKYRGDMGDRKNGLLVNVPLPNGTRVKIIFSDGAGWDHVSVSIPDEDRCPTWEEMCEIKRMFFYDFEEVVQYHPPQKDYVNIAKYCLHLWRPQSLRMPIPPSLLVGPKEVKP